MSTVHPVDQQQALAIATKVIHDSKPAAEFVVLNEKTMERDFGWVFFYLPKRYIETKDMGALTPGSGPLVVLRRDGATAFLSTSVPPNVAIETFERQWRAKNGKDPQN